MIVMLLRMVTLPAVKRMIIIKKTTTKLTFSVNCMDDVHYNEDEDDDDG